MKTMKYLIIEKDNIDFLKDLCNQLMDFQSNNATIRPDIMSSMNFDNRLKTEYKGSKNEFMLVAFDSAKPIGFAYANIANLTEDNLKTKPVWAIDLDGEGFYPSDYNVPKAIGTFKLLYVDPKYRGLNVGKELTTQTMSWLKNQSIDDIWVYVANGNEQVGKLYERYGFKYSHSVYNGFINAYVQKNL